MQVTTSLDTLTTLANNLGYRVYVSPTHKYSYTDAFYKAIVVSISEVETMADQHELDIEQVKLCCVAHEIGHVLALTNGQDYSDEVLAWRHAWSLFQVVPNIFAQVRDLALKTYNLTYQPSDDEIEAEIYAFLKEFACDC